MNTRIFVAVLSLLLLVLLAGIFIVISQDDGDSARQGNGEKTYAVEDVRMHNKKSDCWTIISGAVYDITSYMPRHPGGGEILRACGEDATSLFNSRTTSEGQPVGSGAPHSQTAEQLLSEMKIGVIE